MSMTAQARRSWKEPKTAHASTGFEDTNYEFPPWGLVVRCITRDNIPCTMEEKKAIETQNESKGVFVNMTVLRISSIGKGLAPYKKTPKGKTPVHLPAKNLVEHVPSTNFVNPATGQSTVVAAKVYNFEKTISSFDRGDRLDESSSVIYVGETLRFGMSEFMYEPQKKTFPPGVAVIPSGTIVEVVVTPSTSGDNLDKGYGLKLTNVRIHESTLQSYNVPDSLGYFPSTSDDARSFASKCLEVGAPIRMNVDSGSITMFSSVSPSSFVVDIGEDTPFLRFTSEEGDIVPGIREADVHPDDLMRCLNCPGDIGLARTLADVACAVGAMKLFVYESKYFNRVNRELQMFRCFPVVDSAILLSAVEVDMIPEGQKSGVFPLGVTLSDVGPIGIRVSLREVASSGEDKVPLPCVDLPIASARCEFAKGFRFDIVDLKECDSILEMYFMAFAARRKGRRGGAGRTVYDRKRGFDMIEDGDGGDE